MRFGLTPVVAVVRLRAFVHLPPRLVLNVVAKVGPHHVLYKGLCIGSNMAFLGHIAPAISVVCAFTGVSTAATAALV